MPKISLRRLAVLALLAAPRGAALSAAPVVGSTRLQKLLFILIRSLGRVSGDRQLSADVVFEPYRFGPADLALYQDLEFLEAVGHIERIGPTAGSLGPTVEEATETALSFDYLMGDEAEAGELAEAEEAPIEYRITPSGQALLDQLANGEASPDSGLIRRVIQTAADVKMRFGSWPLPRLLRYVYSEYPEMTTASEIRERVLGYD